MKKSILFFNLVLSVVVIAFLVYSIVCYGSFWKISFSSYLSPSVDHNVVLLITQCIAYYLILCFLVWAVLSVVFYTRFSRLDGNNYENYAALSGIQKVIEYAAVFTPIPLAFFAMYTRCLRRSQRLRVIACPDCGKPMRVLSEEEEDAFLNQNQQFEETLLSLDYDVWLCPDCGKTQIFCYKGRHSRMFRKCPKCGLHAMKFVDDEITIPPTSTTDGVGQRTYKCHFCGNVVVEKYPIPANIMVSPSCHSINIKK